MSDFQTLTYELHGKVAFIRYNQPDVLNAQNEAMAQETLYAINRARDEARAIVLGSHGRAFSSGANLSDGGLRPDDPLRDAGKGLERHFNPLLRMIRDLDIPLITAVRGPAVGVAAGIALSGDIIVAGKSAYFLQSFCNIGLCSDGGAAYLMARAIGRVRTMELMLLGERYPAERAYADGLVTRLVDDAEVDDTALALAEKLANGPMSLKYIRKQAWAALDHGFSDYLDLERDWQRTSSRSEDFVEGVMSFLQKRPPEFKGR